MNLEALTELPPKNRKKEYLSGGSLRTLSPLLGNAVQVLARFQDDLNREFTDRAYDDMLKDPAVAASVDILKSLILSEPLRVEARVQDKKAADYEISKKVADFVSKNLRKMGRSTQAILWEALDAIAYGSSLVETVFEDAVEDGVPVLRLKDLKTRSRSNYALVVDRFYNVLGAIPTEMGFQASGVYTGSTKPDPDKVIPREKFLLVALITKNSDPRGVSLIRPAWNAYYLKTQVWPAYLKFLVQFASPSIVGFTPDNAEEVEVLDDNGTPLLNADGTMQTISAEEDMLATLLGFQNGTVAVLKGGSKLELLKSEGQGEAFSAAVDLFDRQIAMAILKTHRTLLESRHSSKADSESAADITDVFVASLREILGQAFTRDVARVLVEINFGPEIADEYTPDVTLKSMPKQDFSKAADAISKLWTSKFLHSSQVAGADGMVGLPERDMDAFLGELEEEAESRRLDQTERLKLMNPGAGTTKPKAENDAEDEE
ncbi:MAG: DUF935 family protein [Pyrinomonadaceae bacterium]